MIGAYIYLTTWGMHGDWAPSIYRKLQAGHIIHERGISDHLGVCMVTEVPLSTPGSYKQGI